jgi:hypothetical protein
MASIEELQLAIQHEFSTNELTKSHKFLPTPEQGNPESPTKQ